MSTAPRRLGRPPAADRVDTRALLVDVARRLFAELGYESATTKEMARASGITTGAIYHYFGSKLDLYIAVFEEVEATVQSRYAAVIDPAASFGANMRALLTEALAISAEDPSLSQFFVEVQTEARRNEELAPLALEQARNSVRLLAPIAATGTFAEGIDDRAVTYATMAVMTGIARFSAAAGDRKVLEAATGVLARMFEGSLFDGADG